MADVGNDDSQGEPRIQSTGTTALLSQVQRDATFHKQHSLDMRYTVVRAIRRGELSVMDASRQFKVHRNTILLWRNQWKAERSLKPKKKPGRPRKLAAAQVTSMLDFLKANKTASNRMIKANEELHIHESSVSRYLRREGITRKKVSDEPLNYPDERIKGEIITYLAAVEQIPDEKRVYMDESFAYTNEAPSYGRSKKGELVTRPRERHGKKLTFLLAVRTSGIVHEPWIIDKSANDAVCVEYVRDHLVPNLKPGETVIWDRLGRSGRALNPKKQHYNPEIRRMIEEKGCSLLFLPPKGKHFNPIETCFSKIKTHIRNSYTGSTAAQEKRHRNEAELRMAIRFGCAKLTVQDLAGYWSYRGTRRCFTELYPDVVL